MNKYDVTVTFEITGSNQFGASETLDCNRTFTVEAETEQEAIDSTCVEIEVKKISVCKK